MADVDRISDANNEGNTDIKENVEMKDNTGYSNVKIYTAKRVANMIQIHIQIYHINKPWHLSTMF